ncbi:hypothetical protein [Aquifex sp.]
MDWGQVLTIIFGTAGFMGIFMLLMNKRIDDLRQDMDRRFEDVNRRLDKLEEDIKEIRQLLYKVLGAEIKKE